MLLPFAANGVHSVNDFLRLTINRIVLYFINFCQFFILMYILEVHCINIGLHKYALKAER